MSDQNGASRLDRIERLMEILVNEHIQIQQDQKQLLTAQILLTDRVDKLAQTVDVLARHTNEKIEELSDKLNGLIAVVGDFIRKPRPQ